MSKDDYQALGVSWLTDRMNQIGDALSASYSTYMSTLAFDCCEIASWHIVGVGASEGPARLFAATLNDSGIAARFIAPSHFLRDNEACQTGVGLVVFSQGLSPHARLAVSALTQYGQGIVVTARSRADVLAVVPQAARESCHILCHAPALEPGSLLRVVGPACAALTGILLANTIIKARGEREVSTQGELLELSTLYQNANTQNFQELIDDLSVADPVLCLAMSEDLPVAHQLMWKWQEATNKILPPVVDVLSFAHGPFQSIYNQPALLLAIESKKSNAESYAWESVRSILVPGRHRLHSLSSNRSFPISYFDQEAAFLKVLCAVVAHRDLDLGAWPGRGADLRLYELSNLFRQ